MRTCSSSTTAARTAPANWPMRWPRRTRAYRRAVLEGIDYAGVASQGYCFQVDLARRALDAGYRVREVPITFVERERGESKMSGEIVREAFWRVTQWGAAYRGNQVRKAVRRAG